jgi:hypothetical protein
MSPLISQVTLATTTAARSRPKPKLFSTCYGNGGTENSEETPLRSFAVIIMMTRKAREVELLPDFIEDSARLACSMGCKRATLENTGESKPALTWRSKFSDTGLERCPG